MTVFILYTDAAYKNNVSIKTNKQKFQPKVKINQAKIIQKKT